MQCSTLSTAHEDVVRHHPRLNHAQILPRSVTPESRKTRATSILDRCSDATVSQASRARSAAPMKPASGPSSPSWRWRNPRPVSFRLSISRAGSRRRSPASDTPPPTTISGSKAAVRLAIPCRASHRSRGTSQWPHRPGLRCLRHHRPRQPSRVTLHELLQDEGCRRLGLDKLASFAHQCVAARVLLPAAPVPAFTPPAVGDHLHVAELPAIPFAPRNTCLLTTSAPPMPVPRVMRNICWNP